MMTNTKHGTQAEGARILRAQLVARRLRTRVQSERSAALSISRDELASLAHDLEAVATIAERHHLALATAGALPPDAFPGPTE